jgi:hypothetical protein
MMSKRITWGNKCGTSGPDDPEPFEPLRTGTGDLVRGKLVPDPREAAIQELKMAYQDYIAILGAELNEMVPWADSHGWKSHRVEEGRKARERIDAALAAVGGGKDG